jgi:hypothetical protein
MNEPKQIILIFMLSVKDQVALSLLRTIVTFV